MLGVILGFEAVFNLYERLSKESITPVYVLWVLIFLECLAGFDEALDCFLVSVQAL